MEELATGLMIKPMASPVVIPRGMKAAVSLKRCSQRSPTAAASSNDQVVMQLDGRLVQAELSYTTMLNKPVRLDPGPRALVIIEDGTTTNLGLRGWNGLSKQS